MNPSTFDGDYLTVTDISQYYYCPRKLYFIRTLGITQVPKKKMELSKKEHDREDKRQTERKEIYGFKKEEVKEVLKKVKVEDHELKLRGILDYVLVLNNGEMLPVEIKYTDYPSPSLRWRKQLFAYSLLLDSTFTTTIKRAILYFSIQNIHEIIEVSPSDKNLIKEDIKKMRQLIASESIPNKVDDSKCSYCEMKKFCE